MWQADHQKKICRFGKLSDHMYAGHDSWGFLFFFMKEDGYNMRASVIP